jgi:NADPH:quinone reductase-like Zn-dependent oxidoreductase
MTALPANPNPASTATSGPATEAALPIPTTMRAVVHRRYGTAEVLEPDEISVPEPGAGQVLVHVRAASLNALDWHFLTGTPWLIRPTSGWLRPKRIVPGADVAGTVVAVGPGVDDVRVGDAVFGESPGGGCAAFAVVEADHVVPIPDGVDAHLAAATPVAGLTALQALRTHARTQPGEQVLVNGAAGGVGTFAVQIAKALGAEVIAVCSTRNVEMVRRLGADTVVDYTTDDFVAGGGRFDVMVDNVGNRTPAECKRVLLPAGRYVAVSGPKTNRLLGPVPHLVRFAMAFRRSGQSFHQFTASTNRDDLIFLGELLASGRVVPELERTIGLDGVAEALTEIGTGHTRAKIVVEAPGHDSLA